MGRAARSAAVRDRCDRVNKWRCFDMAQLCCFNGTFFVLIGHQVRGQDRQRLIGRNVVSHGFCSLPRESRVSTRHFEYCNRSSFLAGWHRVLKICTPSPSPSGGAAGAFPSVASLDAPTRRGGRLGNWSLLANAGRPVYDVGARCSPLRASRSPIWPVEPARLR